MAFTQQKSTIQKLLDDNSQLILSMLDLQSQGKQNEYLEHQRTLHRNLTYLIQFDPSTSNAFIHTQSSNILNQSTIPQQRSSYSIQQNGSGQYPMHHQQQIPPQT